MSFANDEPDVINITTNAVEKIQGLMEEKELEDHALRIFVQGIACSGPQYALAFDPNPSEKDTVVKVNGLTMVIDPMSLPYLNGASIDFVEGPQGSGFSITNPNIASGCASGTCHGC